jgi:adenine modification enzyme
MEKLISGGDSLSKTATDQVADGSPSLTSPLQLRVKPLDRKLAQEIIVKNHYLHRKASCSYSFGLFFDSALLGVIMFGSPVSSTLCRGICGTKESGQVIELTRLWVADFAPKFSETFFISKALKYIPKDIVVSFADPSVGHVGTIYQAANFIYTGLGAKRSKWISKSRPNLHFHRGATQGRTYTELRKDPDLSYVPAIRKHRYIYFTHRKKELLLKLLYPVVPYPKKESSE